MLALKPDVAEIMHKIKLEASNHHFIGTEGHHMDKHITSIIKDNIESIHTDKYMVNPLLSIGNEVPTFLNRGRLLRFLFKGVARVFLKLSRLFTRNQSEVNKRMYDMLSALTDSTNLIAMNVDEMVQDLNDMICDVKKDILENKATVQKILIEYQNQLEQTIVKSNHNLQDDMNHKVGIVNQNINLIEGNTEELIAKQKQLEHIQKSINDRNVLLKNRIDKLTNMPLSPNRKREYSDIWERDSWGAESYSQCGEDMIVVFVLGALGIPLEDASYIDLGANHAKKISNTYYLYEQGARGVLVEANGDLIPELRFYRGEDTILNRCVSATSGEMIDFYIMGTSFVTGDGLSTAVEDDALSFIEKNPKLKIHKKITVETIEYNDICINYLGKSPVLLNIDIEGKELEILKTIDFTNYRPLMIIVEIIPYNTHLKMPIKNKEISEYLIEMDYFEYAFTGVNAIFVDKREVNQ